MQFQFSGISYPDAVRWFAQNAGKPVLGEIPVPGTLTFADNRPYSYDDALDTLNLLLAMKGYWLVETDRYFRVVPVAQVPNETKILSGLAEMDKVRPGEVVTVVIPLEQMDSETAAKAVVRMVSTWGSISPLSKGRGIIITDSARNIERVRAFLKILDAKSVADTVIESCQLERANARAVADTINSLFAGTPKRAYERNREGKFVLIRQEGGDETVSATADERTNSVILMGAATASRWPRKWSPNSTPAKATRPATSGSSSSRTPRPRSSPRCCSRRSKGRRGPIPPRLIRPGRRGRPALRAPRPARRSVSCPTRRPIG